MEKDGTSHQADASEEVIATHERPLQSWKEIAAYLERDERTARRWENAEGLPIRRHGRGPRSSVYAYPNELDAWRVAREPKVTKTRAASPFLWWSAAGLASVSALLLTVWFIKWGPVFNPPNPFVEASGGITVKEVRPGGYSEGGPSPDGQFFCFVDWDREDIAIENLKTGERRHLTEKGSGEKPRGFAMWCAISPDGSQVAYDWWRNNGNELWVVGLDGSNPRILLGEDIGYYHETVAWSSDGNHIATWGGPGKAKILWVSVDDGSIRELATLENEKWVGKVFHSPDDRYLAYSHTSKTYPPNFDIYLVATDGSGETTTVVEHPAGERVMGWVPGRNVLVFLSDRSGTWDVWCLQIEDGRPKGDPRRVYTDLGNITPIGFVHDGSYFFEVYSRWANNYVATLDPQTGKLVGQLTQPFVGYNIALDWSPDGRYLAYSPVRTSPEGPGFFEGSLSVRDLQTGKDRTVACDLRSVFDVRWSPDGSLLLVSGFRKREVVDARLRSNLFSVDPQTGSTKLLVDKPKQRIIVGEWALDGNGFYFVAGDSVLLHDLESGGEKTIYENSGLTGFLALSPTGERLAVGIDDTDSSSGLTAVDVSSGAAERLLKPEEPRSIRGHFDWSPDGRYVYYMKAEEKQATSLWRADTQGGNPERLWQTAKRVGSPRIHPNGRQITFYEVTHETATWVMEGFIPGSIASE